MYRQFRRSVFFKKNTRDSLCRAAILSFKMPPRLAAVACLLPAVCRRANAPVVSILCFYFAARLSRRSRAACRVPCKRSFTEKLSWFIRHLSSGFRYSIQNSQIPHQTFRPSHRKCPTCLMIFVNTVYMAPEFWHPPRCTAADRL